MKKMRFLRGNLVTHKNRGRGVFEHYSADYESCFVRFDDSGDSSKVTASMLRLRTAKPKRKTS